jgi:hypothetical protein
VKIRKHINYANVISTLALSIALGAGSAFAINTLPDKSIGARQLRPGAVTAKKIRKNAVTAPKIERLAVKQGKIAASAITEDKIATGAVIADKLPTSVIGTEKIADNAVTGEKVNEQSLSEVPSASVADHALFADSSNPEAFAKIDAEGTVFPAFSKGIGVPDVKQGSEPGIYCVNVPGFVPKGAQVTPEYALKSVVTAFVKFGGTPSCPYPQVEVQTYNAGSRQKHPFYIMLYR